MRNLGFALIAGLVACAPPPASLPSPAPASTPASTPPPGYVAIKTPETISDFRLINREHFENEAAGVGLKYERASGLIVDVYVYPGPDLGDNCGLACAQEALAAEVSGFQESFPTLIERGHMQAVRVTGTRRLRPPAGARWRMGHHLALAVRRDDLDQRSDFYLYYLPKIRVKVRATYVDDRANREAVDAFVRALMPALAP